MKYTEGSELPIRVEKFGAEMKNQHSSDYCLTQTKIHYNKKIVMSPNYFVMKANVGVIRFFGN